MAIAYDKLYALIQDAFPDAVIVLKDLVGDADHYHAAITSVDFQGLSRVQQHKKVFDALADILGGPNACLHALGLSTKTKES